MSNAIGLFLRQVVLQRGLPFDVKLPKIKPVALGSLSETELNIELDKGYTELEKGHVRSASDVFTDLNKDLVRSKIAADSSS